MFLYTFPGFLGITPHRHYRVSRVESSFDLIICLAWIIATLQLTIYAECPNQKIQLVESAIIYLSIPSKYCPTLQVTLVLGYLTALLFLWRFIDGIRDQRRKSDEKQLGKHIMFARGSWKD